VIAVITVLLMTVCIVSMIDLGSFYKMSSNPDIETAKQQIIDLGGTI